jgi:predicted RNase H-like HicB family nuclease
MAKKLNVIVKKMPTNYGAFIEEVDGFVITRKTLNQIINDLPQAIKFHIEALNDYEIQPCMLQEIEFTYHYDISCHLHDSI